MCKVLQIPRSNNYYAAKERSTEVDITYDYFAKTIYTINLPLCQLVPYWLQKSKALILTAKN